MKKTKGRTSNQKARRDVSKKKKTSNKKKSAKKQKTSVGRSLPTYTRAAGQSTSPSTSSPHSAPLFLFRTKRIVVPILPITRQQFAPRITRRDRSP
jgi:hypothetical protein